MLSSARVLKRGASISSMRVPWGEWPASNYARDPAALEPQLTVVQPSGVSVLTVAGANKNVATVSFLVNGGARAESGETQGVAAILPFLAQMSTKKRFPFNVMMELADNGTKLTTTACRQSISYTARVQSDYLWRTVHSLAEIVFSPAHHDHEVADQLHAIDAGREDAFCATATAKDNLFRAAFGYSGLGNSVLPSPIASQTVTADAVKAFHSAAFSLRDTTVVAAGVEHDVFVELVKSALADLPASTAAAAAAAPTYFGGDIRQQTACSNATIAIGLSADGSSKNAAAALHVAAAALGAASNRPHDPVGVAKRTLLREHVLTDAVVFAQAEAVVLRDAALLTVVGRVAGPKAKEYVAAVAGQVKQLATTALSADALAKAKAAARFALAEKEDGDAATVGGIKARLQQQQPLRGEDIAAVTAEDVRLAVAGAVRSNPTVSAVGSVYSVPHSSVLAGLLH